MPPAQPYTQADFPRTVPLPMPWWYRADQVTLVGSKASVLKDLSGNGADSLQGTDAKRWAWSATSGPNGTPGLTGAGTQWSQTAGNVNLSAVTQLTVIAVLKPSLTVGSQILVYNRVSTTNLGFQLGGLGGGGIDTYQGLLASPPLSAPLATTSTTDGAPAGENAIIELACDQTLPTNQVTILVNGVQNAQTRTTNNQSTGGLQALPITMGDINGAIGYSGIWSECFGMIGLLTAQQRQNLYRGYLSPRYGIAVP